MSDEKMRFQHWWFINRGYATVFINLGGPPVFKLHFLGGRRRLINNGMLINPDLTLWVKQTFQIYRISITLGETKNMSPRPSASHKHHPCSDLHLIFPWA